jgi:hypothetical protein
VKAAISLPDFALLNPGYVLAPRLIEPKPVLPPGLEKLRRDAIKRSASFLPVPCRKPRMQKTASRERDRLPVIAIVSEAIQGRVRRLLDCFVASLLAMTSNSSAPARRAGGGGKRPRSRDG